MTPHTPGPPLALPKTWPRVVRSATLHAISLASAALTTAWGRAATARSSRKRLVAEIDRLRAEVVMLREELEIKEARWSRVPARRRPYYSPLQRMRILQLRAARGWSAVQTAMRFLLTDETIASWMRRLDEEGEEGLVRMHEPVNKFPAFVGYLVRYLKRISPGLGKKRIAQMLARAGLHLGATTVGRMLKSEPTKADASAGEAVVRRVVTAKRPNHIWHVDLTAVPIGGGFWLPWMPFARPQRWPFSWWAAVVVDHASRLFVGFAIFAQRPTSDQVCAFLNGAVKKSGTTPKYVIADKGKEFFCGAFKGWCRRHGIRPRFGAVGKHGSIAIIERLIRSMKSECTRKILVPLRLDAMRFEIACYARWYNEFRPHSTLDGQTPLEMYRGARPANMRPRFEPRARWPRKSRCAAPVTRIKGRRGVQLALTLGHVEGRAHLPILGLKAAA